MEQAHQAVLNVIARIEDRLPRANDEAEKRLLRAGYRRLLVLLEEIEGQSPAGNVAAAADRLEATVLSAGKLSSVAYLDALGRAVAGIGGAAPPAKAAPATPQPVPGERPVGDPWQQLLRSYRENADIPHPLKIASLAQWIVESGRGTSRLAREHFNFGGIKYRERMAGYATPVEYVGADGDRTAYCRFASADRFIRGYWHFIASGPYDGWQAHRNDAAGYLRHIGRTYAADGAYVEKVLRVFGEAGRLLSGSGTAGAAPGREESFRVAVVVGHNRHAPGAGSVGPLNRSEFAFNSDVAAAMKREAARYDLAVEVILREPASDVVQEILSAYEKVAAFSPDCAIELHFNASAPPPGTGIEMLFRPDSTRAKALAKHLVREVEGVLALPLRRGSGLLPLARADRGAISVYALPNVPTVLCEPFFGNNPDDASRAAAVGAQGLALAYLRALRAYAAAQRGDRAAQEPRRIHAG